MTKTKSSPSVEAPTPCLHDAPPKSLDPDPAQTTGDTGRQKRPLDVAAFNKAMACAKGTDFCICAGTVTLRGTGTQREVLVILNDKYTQKLWQLPKGRKNIGEDALHITAIRETYEETGYKVQLRTGHAITSATMAKSVPGSSPIDAARAAEPVAMVHYTEPTAEVKSTPLTKVCFFYLATVEDDALPTANTQNDDEYLEAYWLTCTEAARRLTFGAERRALQIAMKCQ